MNRLEKEKFVANLKKEFSDSNLLVITHYTGLNVNEMEDLRSKMRKFNVKFKVTKNRISKLALSGTSFENVKELFKGPTAVAYSKESINAAKVAVEFSNNNKKLKIIGGSFEGGLIDKEKIKFLASLPSLDELRVKIVSLIQSPASKIAQVLKAPAKEVVGVINAYSTKIN